MNINSEPFTKLHITKRVYIIFPQFENEWSESWKSGYSKIVQLFKSAYSVLNKMMKETLTPDESLDLYIGKLDIMQYLIMCSLEPFLDQETGVSLTAFLFKIREFRTYLSGLYSFSELLIIKNLLTSNNPTDMHNNLNVLEGFVDLFKDVIKPKTAKVFGQKMYVKS